MSRVWKLLRTQGKLIYFSEGQRSSEIHTLSTSRILILFMFQCPFFKQNKTTTKPHFLGILDTSGFLVFPCFVVFPAGHKESASTRGGMRYFLSSSKFHEAEPQGYRRKGQRIFLIPILSTFYSYSPVLVCLSVLVYGNALIFKVSCVFTCIVL